MSTCQHGFALLRRKLGVVRRREVLVVGFGEVDHHVLRTLRQLSDPARRRARISRECRNDCFRRKNGPVLNHAAVFEHTAATDYRILPDVHVRVDIGRIDDRALAYEHVVADLQREEGNALAKFLERRSDDGLRADDAMTADTDVSQVPTDDGLGLHNVLSVQDYVLRSAEDGLPAYTVSGSLGCRIYGNFSFIIRLMDTSCTSLFFLTSCPC